MESTKAKQATPIGDFKNALFYLEHANDEAARAKKDLEEMTKKATQSFGIARDAAKAIGQSIPSRFMCGQWLFVFGEKGELATTEIPNTEAYQLLELARTMGESDL